MFPCFDAPTFKVPWELTVSGVPEGWVALSNAPPSSERKTGSTRQVVFHRSAPLPSYLYALVVGDLVPVRAPADGPARVTTWVRPAQRALAAFGDRAAAALLGIIEDLCGVPLPFEKLDQAVVSLLDSDGMENAASSPTARRPSSRPTTASRSSARPADRHAGRP